MRKRKSLQTYLNFYKLFILLKIKLKIEVLRYFSLVSSYIHKVITAV